VTILYSIPLLRGGLVRLQTSVFLLLHGAQFSTGLSVFGWPIVGFASGSRVSFGRNLTLISHSCFSEPGVNHPCVLRTLRAGANLTVGDNVGMSGCTICAAESVIIGDNCLLGANAFIADTDFHPVQATGRRWQRDGVRTAPVEIGNNVFVGANALVLKGVTIGDNAVVGAGSVVTADVPPNSVVAGSPARVVGEVR